MFINGVIVKIEAGIAEQFQPIAYRGFSAIGSNITDDGIREEIIQQFTDQLDDLIFECGGIKPEISDNKKHK